MAIEQELLARMQARLAEELASSRHDIEQVEVDIVALTAAGAQEGGVPANHMADEGSDVYERERLLTIRVGLGERIELIEAAMERVADGTFGICERCGQEIGLGRLEALPFARHCIACQEFVDQAEHGEVFKGTGGREARR